MKKRGVVRANAVSFLCYLVMAYVLGLLVSYTTATGVVQGIWLGFMVWLGFAATLGLTGNMFSDKPIAVWVIDAGYQLAQLLIMSLVLTLWRGRTHSPSAAPPSVRPGGRRPQPSPRASTAASR